MNTQKELPQSRNWTSLTKRALVGAGIALLLISLFLSAVKESNPAWPKLWYIRPLIVLPLAGACGGVFYYFIDHLFNQRGWPKIVAAIISLIVYVFGLWMGTVLGLAGTMWH